MAVRSRRKHRYRSRRRSSARARRAAARRLAALRMTNPRRSHRRRHHYRVRRLRNPRRAGGTGFGRRGIVHMATGAGVGMIGAVGLDYLWQYLSTNVIPAQYQSGYLGTAVKAAVAVGAGWGLSKVGVSKAAAAAGTVGALTVIAYQLVHQMIASAAPTAAIAATTTTATPTVQGLAAYMRPSSALGWMSPGTPLRGLGRVGRVGAYMANGNMAPNVNRPGGSVSMSGLAMPGGY